MHDDNSYHYCVIKKWWTAIHFKYNNFYTLSQDIVNSLKIDYAPIVETCLLILVDNFQYFSYCNSFTCNRKSGDMSLCEVTFTEILSTTLRIINHINNSIRL